MARRAAAPENTGSSFRQPIAMGGGQLRSEGWSQARFSYGRGNSGDVIQQKGRNRYVRSTASHFDYQSIVYRIEKRVINEVVALNWRDDF